jgi:recombination protein RecA
MSEEQNNLEKTLKELDKKFGKGSVFIGSNAEEKFRSIQRWKVDSPLISYILGGGIPKGRIIELYGPESSGKTTLATYLGKQVQGQGGRVAVIDAENSYDLEYARNVVGLNTDDIIFSQPDSGEQALEIAETLAATGEVDYIIIDSVAALTPLAELEAEMGDQQMGLQARLMSKACRKMRNILNTKDCTIVFINQIRMKIGVMYGNPETTPGGKALKFFTSIRLEVRKVEYITKGKDDPTGIKSRLKSSKNKTAPPFRKGEFVIDFSKGIDPTTEYVDFAVQYNIIEKSGSWYSYNGDRLGQGKDNVVNELLENEKLFDEIKDKVNNYLYPKKEDEKPVPKKRGPKPKKEEPTVELNSNEKEKKDDK